MINKTELIKQLRAATQAPMGACKDALTEAEWDFDKAVDIVKVKGLQQTSKSEGKVAAEGVVVVRSSGTQATLVEINCQTDFVAKSEDFINFADGVSLALYQLDLFTFDGNFDNVQIDLSYNTEQNQYETTSVNEARKHLMSTTKENIVVRRWFRVEVTGDNRVVNTYLHNNSKVASAVSFEVSNPEVLNSCEFQSFADDIAMQIVAMSSLVVSADKLPQDVLDRQTAIFEQQILELKKPAPAAAKILEGKIKKWQSEVCLLDQESVVVPKSTIKSLMDKLALSLNCDIKVLDFVRVQVGEGIEVEQANLVADVAQMME